ncbi:MAG: hypothetical protein AAF696_34520 [Bacteroidota bacterium]
MLTYALPLILRRRKNKGTYLRYMSVQVERCPVNTEREVVRELAGEILPT